MFSAMLLVYSEAHRAVMLLHFLPLQHENSSWWNASELFE
jgi:hypothetical protein